MRTTRKVETARAGLTRGPSGREPIALQSTMGAGISGGMTLFGAKKASGLAARKPGRPVPWDSRPPWTSRARDTGGSKARGQRRKMMRKATVTMLVFALMVALLAGVFWSGAQAGGSGQGDRVAAQDQRDDEGGATDRQGAPAARPHPRGLPRAVERDRRRRDRRPRPEVSGILP